MIQEILQNKLEKPKSKIEAISKLLLEGKISMDELIETASKSKDPDKANCIEAMEFATRENPKVGDKKCFDFVTQTLLEKAPRIKWESAKVIGNIAQFHTNHLEKAIAHLLVNTEHTGTVVRWSAAFALGEIVKLKTKHNTDLLPAVDSIIKREEKESIKKIYLAAIKKISK